MREMEKDIDADEYNAFIDYLSRFIRLARREDADVKSARMLVTANASRLFELRQHIDVFAAKGAMHHVDAKVLSQVIQILHTRISYGVEVCKKLKKNQFSKTASSDTLPSVLCASTALSILSAHGAPRSLLVEELLETIVDLFDRVSTSIIFPLCDPLYKTSKAKSKQKKAKKSPRDAAPRLNADDTEDHSSDEYAPSHSERRKSGTKRAILKRDEALLEQVYNLLDAFSALHRKEHFLPHSVVSRVARVCVHSLSVTGINRYQSHAIQTACMIFASYPDHRLPILDDVREVAGAVPAARRHLRCFKVAEDQTSIRASSALFAQLVCIASSDPTAADPEGHTPRSKPAAQEGWASVRKTRHDRAVKMAVHVLEPLLKHVCTDRDPEFKMAFQTLLEDLLLLYGRPEWPSAELMLQTLSVSVITRLRASEEKTVYAKCVHLDVLGSLAAKMCDLYGIEVLKDIEQSLSFNVKVDALEEAREKLLLYLDPKRSLQFTAANAFYEALFLIDDTSIAKNLKRRMEKMDFEKNKTNTVDEQVIDGEDGPSDFPTTASEALQEISKKRSENVSARRMRNEEVSRSDALVAACFVGKNRSFTAGFNTILQAILEGLHDSAPTVRAKSIKALSSVDDACQGFLCHLPNVLHYIEASCRDVSTLARDAALELISRSLLQHMAPEQPEGETPEHEGKDKLKGDPILMSNIFSIVEKRLCDTATSVRKRAISIMRSILLSALQQSRELRRSTETPLDSQRHIQVQESRIVQICTNLVNRLEDPEPTVKEAAERTLRLGLFGFDISQELKVFDAIDQDKANQLANRLIGVFSRLPTSIHSSFMSRVMHKALLIKQKTLLASILNAAVERIHGCEAKMANITGGRVMRDMSKEDLSELRLLSAEKVACSSIISAFASLDPSLVSPHCKALAPAIKDVSGNITDGEIYCVQRILNVLEIGVAAAKDVDTSFVEEVMHDIDIIVCTSPVSALEEAAVRCFCVIARKSDLESCKALVHRSASAFLSFLATNIDNLRTYCTENMPDKMSWLERNARFALIRLGLLARYGEFESSFVEEVYETLATASGAVSVITRRDILARAAVRGLSHFLIRHRSHLQKGTRILVNLLDASAEEDISEVSEPPSERVENGVPYYSEGVRLYVLQGFHDLLRDEEERNSYTKPEPNDESRKRRRPSDVTAENTSNKMGAEFCEGNSGKVTVQEQQVVLAAEEDSEAGFLALSAQLMVPRLQKAVRSSSIAIRRIAANIFGLLVRQGLLLPATAVTSLFILLLDNDKRCRELACRVVRFLADRHAGMFASAALPALRSCFEACFDVISCGDANQQSETERELEHVDNKSGQCNGGGDGGSERGAESIMERIIEMSVDEKSGISLLSQALMSMRREQRRGVLECIMKEFDPRVCVRSVELGTDNSNETRVNDNDVNGRSHDDSIAKVANGEAGHVECEDEDDDVGPVGTEVLDVYGAEKLCALPTLYFLASTIACIDYTNGAGIGGCLTQGGGTAAAEAKLKAAKEEVNELVGIATRIVSNSGQAVLQVTKQVLRKGDVSGEKKSRMGMYAGRMSLLLALKQHLKFSRWKSAITDDEAHNESEGGSGSRTTVRLPEFRPDGRLIEIVYGASCGGGMGGAGGGMIGEEDAQVQMELFCKLMREDAIDEMEVTSCSRKVGRRGRGVSGSGRKRGARASGSGVGSSSKAFVKKSRVRGCGVTAGRLRYGEDSDSDKEWHLDGD